MSPGRGRIEGTRFKAFSAFNFRSRRLVRLQHFSTFLIRPTTRTTYSCLSYRRQFGEFSGVRSDFSATERRPSACAPGFDVGVRPPLSVRGTEHHVCRSGTHWRREDCAQNCAQTPSKSGYQRPTLAIEIGEIRPENARRGWVGLVQRGLANRRLQPLGHLTATRKLSIRQALSYGEPSCPQDCP